MQEALIWLLLVELFGLAALPLAFQIFRYLPERGLTLAKPLGLLVVGWLVWLISMLGLPFNATICWLILTGLMVGLNAWLFLRQNRRLGHEMLAWATEHKGLIILAELIFVLAYVYLVNLRSYMPDIRDQEKFGDYAFLNSLSLFDKMPPADPWMSGYPINYYYFSHFLMAMLVKMSGLNPAIAFNLTVPLVFGLTCLGSFGLVFNLVAIARARMIEARRSWHTPALFGLLGLAMVALLGNLDTLRQILAPRPDKGEYTPGNFFFSWWTPSRVIHDYMPQPNGQGGFNFTWSETINEFPMFSFLLADAHPHLMTLPAAMVVITLALNVLLTPARAAAMRLRRTDGLLFFGVTALSVGALYFLNTWDYPTYLLLVLAAAGLRVRLSGSKPLPAANPWHTPFKRWLGWSVGLVLLSLALYLPFHLTFVSLLGDNQVPEPVASVPLLGSLAKTISFVAWDRTPLLGYILVFGIFILPLVSFLMIKLWPYLKAPYDYLDNPTDKAGLADEPDYNKYNWGYITAGIGLSMLLASELAFYLLKSNALLTVLLAIVAAPFIAAGIALMALRWLAVFRSERPRRLLLAVTGGLAGLLVLGGWLLRFELGGPLIIAGSSAALLLWFESGFVSKNAKAMTEEGNKASSADYRPIVILSDLFALALLLLGVVLTFGTELIIIRDVFNSRLNTVFKFYYQAWILFGLAAAYAAWRVAAWAWKAAPFDNYPLTANGLEEKQQLLPVRPAYIPAAAYQTTPVAANLVFSPAGRETGSDPAWSYNAGLEPPASLSSTGPGASRAGWNEFDDLEAEAAEDYQAGSVQRAGWRWLWAFGLGLMLLAGMIYPIFGPYEKTGHYAKRAELDGSLWLRDGGATGAAMPEDYKAITWLQQQLKADHNFAGTILETSGPDWVDYSRVSTFTGLPTLMGWIGHENQWRGGKAPARADSFDCGLIMSKYNILPPPRSLLSQQKDEPWCRLQMVDYLYKTFDSATAQEVLKAASVRYVFVGSLEQSWVDSNRTPAKNYPPEGLAKFAQFMKVIYQQDGVKIYSF